MSATGGLGTGPTMAKCAGARHIDGGNSYVYAPRYPGKPRVPAAESLRPAPEMAVVMWGRDVEWRLVDGLLRCAEQGGGGVLLVDGE